MEVLYKNIPQFNKASKDGVILLQTDYLDKRLKNNMIGMLIL